MRHVLIGDLIASHMVDSGSHLAHVVPTIGVANGTHMGLGRGAQEAPST